MVVGEWRKCLWRYVCDGEPIFPRDTGRGRCGAARDLLEVGADGTPGTKQVGARADATWGARCGRRVQTAAVGPEKCATKTMSGGR